jgi:hypothetical protein
MGNHCSENCASDHSEATFDLDSEHGPCASQSEFSAEYPRLGLVGRDGYTSQSAEAALDVAKKGSKEDDSGDRGGLVPSEDPPKPASTGTALQLLQQAFGFASVETSERTSVSEASQQESNPKDEKREEPLEEFEVVLPPVTPAPCLEMVLSANGEDKVLVLHQRPFGAEFGKRGNGPTRIKRVHPNSYASDLGVQADWIVKSVGGVTVTKWTFEETQGAITKGLMTLPTQTSTAKGKGKGKGKTKGK